MEEKDKLKQQEHYDNKKIRYVSPLFALIYRNDCSFLNIPDINLIID